MTSVWTVSIHTALENRLTATLFLRLQISGTRDLKSNKYSKDANFTSETAEG